VDAIAAATSRQQAIDADLKALQSMSLTDPASIVVGKNPAVSIPSSMLAGIITSLIEAKTADSRCIGQAIDTVQSCMPGTP